MNILEEKLNQDVVYYIKQCTVKEIKKDACKLYDYFADNMSKIPLEPSGNKEYNVWLQYMMYHTQNVKPVQNNFIKIFKDIEQTEDFDTCQILYNKLKDTFDSLYDLNKKIQYSRNYDFGF